MKCKEVFHKGTDDSRSRPARGAWVEMPLRLWNLNVNAVAPRTGRVG